MPEFSIQRVIDAPRQAVWENISDFGNIYKFHPGVEKSALIGDKECGMGAKRICTFYNGRGFAEEEVAEYVEGKSMTVNLIGGSLPLKHLSLNFDLNDQPTSKTALELTVVFEMRYGLLGRLMGALMMKPMMKKMMGELLHGLEQHIVTGMHIGPEGKLEAVNAR